MLTSGSGEATNLLGTGQIVDGSSHNGKHRELEPLNAALFHAQRLAGVGRLTASVAHELTNPIGIITATCNNLLSQIADDDLSTDELLRYVEMIDHSAWRAARLVMTLRDYTHTDSLSVEPCDLNQVIQNSLTLVAYEFERRYSIKIVADLEPDLPLLDCNQNQVTQVLINLLTNAGDALRESGGTIRVASFTLEEEGALGFSVGDTGTGVPPEISRQIFEPFFTTKPVGKGTGLGLSIASNIVELHGGRIQLANSSDGGATFTVTLPLHSRQETESNGEIVRLP
jgi:two-component system NtrC family sensor kinase